MALSELRKLVMIVHHCLCTNMPLFWSQLLPILSALWICYRHSKEAEGVELGLGLRREGGSDLGAELIAARWHRSKASKANVGR